MDAALHLLPILRRNGIRLGIVSNGWTDFQNRTVDAIGIRDAVDAFSFLKPRICESQMPASSNGQRLGWMSGRVIASFVGDNPEADVLEAEGATMRSIWLRRSMEWPLDRPPAPICIDDLAAVFRFSSE